MRVDQSQGTANTVTVARCKKMRSAMTLQGSVQPNADSVSHTHGTQTVINPLNKLAPISRLLLRQSRAFATRTRDPQEVAGMRIRLLISFIEMRKEQIIHYARWFPVPVESIERRIYLLPRSLPLRLLELSRRTVSGAQ